MQIPRIGRRTVRFPVTATNADGQTVTVDSVVAALLPIGRTPRRGTIWVPIDFENGEWVVVINGSDAPPYAGALVVLRNCHLYAKVATQDDIDAKLVETIELT